MTNLYDYDLLLHEVFYRGWHILTYLEKHKDLDDLEKECISNTILDALVYKGYIDPEKQSLDLDNCCIVNDTNHFCYQKHPKVTGIPLWMKEKLRTICIKNSKSVPITFQLLKPTVSSFPYCLYDPCLSASVIFSDFSLDDYIYDSPTRKGYRLKKEESRPFLDVEIEGVHYLIDVLLKRMYNKESFVTQFRATRTLERSKTRFYLGEGRKVKYERLITQTSSTQFANMLSFILYPLKCNLLPSKPKYAEIFYEVEKSKEMFLEAWKEYEMLEKGIEGHFRELYNKSAL